MRNVLKEIAFLLAFLMLMTSCYTYKPAHLSQRYELQAKDHVTIEAKGKKYNDAKVRSVTDSTVVLVDNGELYEVKKDDIESLEKAEKSKGKTIALISISVVLIVWLTLGIIGFAYGSI